MPDSVLVAIDGSPLSERALTYAVENFPDADITATCGIDPIDSVTDVESGADRSCGDNTTAASPGDPPADRRPGNSSVPYRPRRTRATRREGRRGSN